jgi:SAM-dependent methyltransferase
MNGTDSIAAHSAIAPYYKYRAPYSEELFAALAQRLGLNSSSRLLDVCCGGGEVASGLARYAGKIYAIDGSAEMMSFAPRQDNVAYAQCDVNAATFRAGEPIDHVLIGRAMHHVSIEGLKNLIDANLKPGGSVVTCTALYLQNQPWHPALDRVLEKYRRRSGGTADSKDTKTGQIDVAGIPKLRALGFETTARLQLTRNVRLDLRQLMQIQLSYGYRGLGANLIANMDRFMDDLAAELSGYLRDDKVESAILCWALIFRRRAPYPRSPAAS